VRAYLALKIAGHSADTPHMLRAAGAIRARGGAGAADPLTRTYLALLGQAPFPALPPVQAVLLPKWLGGVECRPGVDRATSVALGIIGAHRPATPSRKHGAF
jgi:squalene-hopene/tetraprenyl-beta-curcumene cyclase